MLNDPAAWHGSFHYGWIEVICGPMFAGKTEELLRRVRRCLLAQQKVVIVKPEIDKRYDTQSVVSHDGRRIEARAVPNAQAILPLAYDAEVVAIDEAQFFDVAIVEVCTELANAGKRVIVAGLEMDYLARPFGPMPELLAVADHITKLQAVCVRCGAPASFSHRKVPAEEQILLGSLEAYEPLCRRCFFEALQKEGQE